MTPEYLSGAGFLAGLFGVIKIISCLIPGETCFDVRSA